MVATSVSRFSWSKGVSRRAIARSEIPAAENEAPAVEAPAVTPQPAPAVAKPTRPTTPRRKRAGAKVRSQYIPSAARYYPPEARRRGVQGTVIVIVTVDARGRVIDVKVSKSSGSRLLDDAAIRLMYDARFHAPGVESKAKAPVNFILR